MTEPTLRIAFVVQRYGLEVNGGAELHCRWVAEHMLHYADVHVFTTCAQEYTTWKNEYSPGLSVLNGVKVHRYIVDHARNLKRFNRFSRRVLDSEHTYFDELKWMHFQGPISAQLLSALAESRDDFDVFIFFTYLYASTYFGLPLVAEKAFLVPTAHDEPTLYLDLFNAVFHLPRYILYNTVAERSLVQRNFRNTHIPSTVVGTGIEIPEDIDGERFRQKYGIETPFLLYVGRVAESKNVPELIDFFLRFKEQYTKPLRLVLLGKPVLPVIDHEDVISLGFVSESDKFDALKAAELLILPSKYESLSMVLLESWLMEKPVLVNGLCEVSREQCVRSNGGLYYQNYSEFAIMLQILLEHGDLRRCLGGNGRQFVQANYSWSVIEAKYLSVFAKILEL